MAEIKEVTVSRSCRVNIGNFEGTEHFISMKAELEDFDDPVEEHDKLASTVERAMVAMLYRSYKVRGKKMTPAQVAKHHGLSWVPKQDPE